MNYYIVTYKGKFGFIKPWTAVRDGETFSQQFLTPSIIEGIEKKLFPEQLAKNGVIERILRHKLSYDAIDIQQEVTHARGWKVSKKEMTRDRAVLKRGVMLNPILYLAFSKRTDAEIAAKQHICLCRNEDIMLPEAEIQVFTEEQFANLNGFELRFGMSEQSFVVGYNRFNEGQPMYGWIEYNGNKLL
ncbi:MAG: hypothetical protein U0L67_09000 [Paludibacteraceae bacterium]|nr:hypothetical protein [Paludibacteraceae bacterium]